ncbi:MAG: tRNA preQ1(34) S-adenosylmethionine ribosyltransferase-isomerase QueA [Planctomycetaceae bacterium]|jgi:S-adenosylmethionine:tRNA ribosyltransferase-isomerase|nr:tRNA preQ1(34) S-adenosylmethionine ribosyltransferase-isomerase QueA [Planctomycetaceae bacterium]
MNLDDYDYNLPTKLIAQHPLVDRSAARLLVVDRNSGSITHRSVADLPDILKSSDVLVNNDTKVVKARLFGVRVETGGRWEGLFLEASDKGGWLIVSKTRGKIKPGESILLSGGVATDNLSVDANISLEFREQLDGGVWRVVPDCHLHWNEILESRGDVPIPPYIRSGQTEDSDQLNYQTVFADKPGAVAAPTAGLHFTEALNAEMAKRGIKMCSVTLHVGLGTFRPISSPNIDDHVMHSERGEINSDVAQQLQTIKDLGGRVVCIGTTAVRVLETAVVESSFEAWSGTTRLFIKPPYKFKAVDVLMTNFHLPKSTLLILVRQFGGDELIRRAYQEAIDREYRFFSYGDAMLIL